jgi:hypothetical protein
MFLAPAEGGDGGGVGDFERDPVLYPPTVEGAPLEGGWNCRLAVEVEGGSLSLRFDLLVACFPGGGGEENVEASEKTWS